MSGVQLKSEKKKNVQVVTHRHICAAMTRRKQNKEKKVLLCHCFFFVSLQLMTQTLNCTQLYPLIAKTLPA